ncbi:glutamyl-tRNA amidotransferase [Fomitiporia mediterranea MF3/22]|uniref:glutamyl-tRNA amidotransferase n=1 Tax=Fomitiporia mediterranea (strain MF3/22) TaxID=694068 RepID=UPI0004408A9E|nr:glutamyl-tRNA amidotransferase [Fomitiporia mediterranea MF3/22]EJD01369.1 glutamyl-tRNA amidotransferase [Fomitiporia mediterranea MF3/22]
MLRRCSKSILRHERTYRRFSLSTKAGSASISQWPGWEVVIGLEVHAQIKSRAKLFSYAWTSKYDEPPNTHVDLFDASFPGTLPKLNSSCVDLAVRAALALNAKIQRHSAFDRKHYFYSDLPAGYQITQQYAPLAKGGYLKLQKCGLSVKIKQIQLEQDTAKSTFDDKKKQSAIDLNRAGTALMEIVSDPDMTTPEQAGEYLRTLQALLRTIGSSDGNMDEGSLRCDANVSVNRIGESRGTRCEIKNLNSVKFMTIAIKSEILRHISLLEKGGTVAQETRGFDEQRAETYLLRSKEDAPDYRYMPDPNLPPLLLEDSYIESVRSTMPELPEQTRARLLSRGLSERDVNFLMSIDEGREVGFDGRIGSGLVSYFDAVAKKRDPKAAMNWITHDLYGLLVARKETFRENVVSVEQLRDLIDLVESNKVTGTAAKQILRYIIEKKSRDPPAHIAQELSLLALVVGDRNVGNLIDKYCDEAVKALPEEAEVIRNGNTRVLNKLVGYIMRASKGRVDAQTVQTHLKKLLIDKPN